MCCCSELLLNKYINGCSLTQGHGIPPSFIPHGERPAHAHQQALIMPQQRSNSYLEGGEKKNKKLFFFLFVFFTGPSSIGGLTKRTGTFQIHNVKVNYPPALWGVQGAAMGRHWESWQIRKKCYLKHNQTVKGSRQTGELSAVQSIYREVSKISFACFIPPPF